MNAQKYVKDIINAFENVICQQVEASGNRAWTNAVKKVIGELGKKHKYRVCCSGLGEDYDSEWLYDLVWYKYEKSGRLHSAPVVLESEWNRSHAEIMYDFQKLLVSSSPVKVMVFQSDEKSYDWLFKEIKSAVKSYNPNTDCTYILACYLYINETNMFKIARVNVSPGNVGELRYI